MMIAFLTLINDFTEEKVTNRIISEVILLQHGIVQSIWQATFLYFLNLRIIEIICSIKNILTQIHRGSHKKNWFIKLMIYCHIGSWSMHNHEVQNSGRQNWGEGLYCNNVIRGTKHDLGILKLIMGNRET